MSYTPKKKKRQIKAVRKNVVSKDLTDDTDLDRVNEKWIFAIPSSQV